MIKTEDRKAVAEMTDEQYFASPRIKRLLDSILTTISGALHRVTVVWEEGDEADACTTGNVTIVNANNMAARRYASRQDKLLTMIGLVGHEGGHFRYSDFDVRSKYLKSIEKGKYLYGLPRNITEETESQMIQYLEENTTARRIISKLAAWIHNVLSDGNMEPLICRDYPGNVAKGIRMYNDCIINGFEPVEEQLLTDPLQGILDVMLQYLYMKGWVGSADAFATFIDPIIVIMEELFQKSTAMERVKGTTKILSILWPFIRDLIDSSDAERENRLNQYLGSNASSVCFSEDADADSTAIANVISAIDAMPLGNGGNPDSNAALNQLEQDILNDQVSNRILEDLEKEREDMDMGPHDPKVRITASFTATSYTQAVMSSLLMETTVLSRQVGKRMEDILKRKDGYRLDGMPIGRRLSRNLYRTDQKIFSKEILPGPGIDMVVAMLIDESGSMYGENIEIARKVAFIVTRFCRDLNIPIAVTGHTAIGEHVYLHQYVDFEPQCDDFSNLSHLRSLFSNYDGYALRYIIKRLENRPEEVKVLFVISDGSPTEPEQWKKYQRISDMQEVIKKAKKDGIIVIATSLERDAKSVRNIYGEDCLDITDLTALPSVLPRMLERFVA